MKSLRLGALPTRRNVDYGMARLCHLQNGHYAIFASFLYALIAAF